MIQTTINIILTILFAILIIIIWQFIKWMQEVERKEGLIKTTLTQQQKKQQKKEMETAKRSGGHT